MEQNTQKAIDKLWKAAKEGTLPRGTQDQLISVLRDVADGCYGYPKHAIVEGTAAALRQFADALDA